MGTAGWRAGGRSSSAAARGEPALALRDARKGWRRGSREGRRIAGVEPAAARVARRGLRLHRHEVAGDPHARALERELGAQRRRYTDMYTDCAAVATTLCCCCCCRRRRGRPASRQKRAAAASAVSAMPGRSPYELASAPSELPPTCTAPYTPPALGAHDQRVAFIVRGEAFRHYTLELSSLARRRMICSNSTWRMQQALARSHVANIITPIEEAGVRVDVFLATYGCRHAHSESDAAQWHADLRSWYCDHGGRPQRSCSLSLLPRSQTDTMRTAIVAGLRDALAHGPYRSVLLWRFDLVPMAPLDGGASPSYLKVDQTAFGCWANTLDYAYHSPGSMLSCFADVFARPCYAQDSVGYDATGCTRAFFSAMLARGYQKSPVLGKGYGAAMRIALLLKQPQSPACAYLRDRYGGPGCDQEAVRRELCTTLPAAKDASWAPFVDRHSLRVATATAGNHAGVEAAARHTLRLARQVMQCTTLPAAA